MNQQPSNHFISNPTHYLFFTGKGGVGKTSLACATAVHLADRGKNVLLVSTDPASNLDEVLGVELNSAPTTIEEVKNLSALNIDPEAAALAYRERSIGPYRGLLPADSIREMEEQLSGACTVEVAAFDEFTSLLLNDRLTSKFDHIIFDTAPTGHTLRLLSLPSAWNDFLGNSTHGASCLGPSSALKNQRARYEQAVQTLKNSSSTTVILVARPDSIALAEAARTSQELESIGLCNQQVAINGIFKASHRSDKTALAFEARANTALAHLPKNLASKQMSMFELKPFNVVGIHHLREFFEETKAVSSRAHSAPLPASSSTLQKLVDGVIADGRCLVMVMGKGGVGKTTIAAAIALEIATRGHAVHLTTTDPAAHLSATLAKEAGITNLQVSRIDPRLETQNYIEHIISINKEKLDPDGLALLEEDLRSPCTEEVAVFHAFTRIVNEASHHFVVVDTAPTGHTLLLLDAAGSFQREVIKKFSQERAENQGSTPMMRIKDPKYTKLLIVTLPETTPISEAKELQKDLLRAEIEPYGWVINQCLAGTLTKDVILQQRACQEAEQILRVQGKLTKNLILVPWQTESPHGISNLLELAHST